MLVRQRVYAAIKNDILSGVYRMGAKLSVQDLASQHGVSKTPVREALSALQHEGLVDILPRVGYFVSHMSVEEVQNLFQVRLILEGASAELAAKNITRQELLDLEEIPCTWTIGDLDSYLQYLRDNREFHLKIAAATRNQHLADLVAGMLDKMQGLLLWELEVRNQPEEFAGEHRQLLMALKERNGIMARKAMELAITEARQALLAAVMDSAQLPIISSMRVSP
jgi:DNA-binding GntR family transcriptional regulator